MPDFKEIPDFANSTDVMATDSGDAISTIDMPDFANSADVSTEPAPVKNERNSIISQIAQWFYGQSPVGQMEASLYLQDKLPDIAPDESMESYSKKVNEILGGYEKEQVAGGIGKVLQTEFEGMIFLGAVGSPIRTATALLGFSAMDKFVNLRRWVEKNIPNTAPEIKDIAEIVDFGIKAALIGGGIKYGEDVINNRITILGQPKNVNISAKEIGKIKDSGNLLPKEKTDFMETIGVQEKHIDASLANGLPINVPVKKVIELGKKPYWEKLKQELEIKTEPPIYKPKATNKQLLASELYDTQAIKDAQKMATEQLAQGKKDLANVALGRVKALREDILKEQALSTPTGEGKVNIQPILSKIKSLQSEKKLSNITVSKLKKFIGIENIKRAEVPQLEKLQSFLSDLKEGDKFLSENQVKALKGIIGELSVPEITPKRVVIDKFGEQEAIFEKGVTSKIPTELIPTVDIKEGHPLITRIVEGASNKFTAAENIINERDIKLDKMLNKAEKSRSPLLPLKEKLSRAITPQNKEIFQALSGEKVTLTPEEAAVTAYLRNFFSKAKRELALEKYRKNYVTHIEKPLTEKILEKGIYDGIKDVLSRQKKTDIPIDIMLELDNIIGSKKFFKFALERKGGINPTTNIRRILHQYSSLYETKKVLDDVLPEGQAITKILLKGKSAIWMKRFLQNLKGRGLDYNFRSGPAAWLTKIADGIVDIGYLKLLSLNWKSGLKNLIAGETNSWIYQDFPTYLKGKERLIRNPKKAIKMATEYGALEGTYADFTQKGIGRLKKLQDLGMIQQKLGETEIRSSIFASMLTEKEWKSGKITPERYNQIKDVIAITQGVFSKMDSPLWVQTWYGRMFFQMNRWRITNAMLLRRLTNNAVADIKAGNFQTQNTSRFGKALLAYGIGMYISKQLADAGLKVASGVARNMAQTIDGVMSLFTEGELIKMFTDNPTLSALKEIFATIQNFFNYIHFPGVKRARGKGIEKTYIAPIRTIKDISEEIEQLF